jgi:hypothetical protein
VNLEGRAVWIERLRHCNAPMASTNGQLARQDSLANGHGDETESANDPRSRIGVRGSPGHLSLSQPVRRLPVWSMAENRPDEGARATSATTQPSLPYPAHARLHIGYAVLRRVRAGAGIVTGEHPPAVLGADCALEHQHVETAAEPREHDIAWTNDRAISDQHDVTVAQTRRHRLTTHSHPMPHPEDFHEP